MHQHIKQQYGYLFVLLFLVDSIALGGWARNNYSLPSQRDNQVVAMSIVHVGAASGAVGAGLTPVSTAPAPNPLCPCPIPQPSLEMNAGARLLIPAIGVDAPVEPVGLRSNGALDVPQKNQWTGVGWYKYGPVPGQSGSAIIDGHLDRPGGAPAVFRNLNQLHKGDIVMVVGALGQVLHFRVVQLQAYQPDKAPLDKIYGDTSGTYLNLITCAGQWIPSQHQTTLRLVVYTKMV